MAASAFIEILGFIAGIVICISAAPQIRALLRNPAGAKFESISRNILIVAGNLLWLVYGILTSSLSIAVMCAVGVLLNTLVLHFALVSRWGERRNDAVRSTPPGRSRDEHFVSKG
ncbi:MAG: hypothetical protein GKS00_22085 [Alphaproteobacteria bacterium]|nr:hypothetical protein [Alphaproteobacteria bacterium]